MANLKRIETLHSPPSPGRIYLVPTVRHRWAGKVFDWPVLLPLHKDADLNFDVWHWQVDGRFTSKAMGRHAYSIVQSNFETAHYRESGRSQEEVDADCASTIALIDNPGEPVPRRAQWRPLRCRRPVIDRIWRCSATIAKVERAVADRREAIVRNGRIYCPHQGADLTSQPVDEAGRVRCPMHQLLVTIPKNQPSSAQRKG